MNEESHFRQKSRDPIPDSKESIKAYNDYIKFAKKTHYVEIYLVFLLLIVVLIFTFDLWDTELLKLILITLVLLQLFVRVSSYVMKVQLQIADLWSRIGMLESTIWHLKKAAQSEETLDELFTTKKNHTDVKDESKYDPAQDHMDDTDAQK